MMARRASMLAVASGLVALAAGCVSEPKTTAATQPGGGSGCLQTFRVDYTDILDDRTILYHMKDGKVWRNSLPFACPSLKNEGGFAYAAESPDICSNEGSIRVLRSGIVCQLGAFTLEPPPAKASQPQ